MLRLGLPPRWCRCWEVLSSPRSVGRAESVGFKFPPLQIASSQPLSGFPERLFLSLQESILCSRPAYSCIVTSSHMWLFVLKLTKWNLKIQPLVCTVLTFPCPLFTRICALSHSVVSDSLRPHGLEPPPQCNLDLWCTVKPHWTIFQLVRKYMSLLPTQEMRVSPLKTIQHCTKHS